MAQPRACCFEAIFLNTTLTTHLLSMVHARLNAAKLPRCSACSSKHRFFFIPVLRSIRLFLCKNRFKIWLAQEPPAAANDAHFFLLPQMGLGSALSVGIFLAEGVVSGSPKSPQHMQIQPRECGALGSTGPLARTRWVIPERRTGYCYQKIQGRKRIIWSQCEPRFELGSYLNESHKD